MLTITHQTLTWRAGIYFLLSFFILIPFVRGQNLIPNPGFEEFTVCPGDYTQDPVEFRARGWTSATAGTPDQFHQCSNGEADVPHNWAGIAEAYEGGGYAGIYLWTYGLNYREYLECKLASPLVRDSTYIVEFHFRLSSYSMFAIDRIGLSFADSLVKIKRDKVIHRSPDIGVVRDSALTKQTGLWEVVRQEYTAHGNEQYVVIGNFDDDDRTKSYHLKFVPEQQIMLKGAAYYYIDNVTIEPKYSPEKMLLAELAPEFDVDHIEVNKTYVLKNINFEFNSYKLSYASTETLDALAIWLDKNKSVYIVLGGHTDDVGSDQFNLTLSRNRARSVASYLALKGIATERISHNGFGEGKPLIPQTTEDARKVNRRVEVKFLK